jgi:hypothetical protein
MDFQRFWRRTNGSCEYVFVFCAAAVTPLILTLSVDWYQNRPRRNTCCIHLYVQMDEIHHLFIYRGCKWWKVKRRRSACIWANRAASVYEPSWVVAYICTNNPAYAVNVQMAKQTTTKKNWNLKKKNFLAKLQDLSGVSNPLQWQRVVFLIRQLMVWTAKLRKQRWRMREGKETSAEKEGEITISPKLRRRT